MFISLTTTMVVSAKLQNLSFFAENLQKKHSFMRWITRTSKWWQSKIKLIKLLALIVVVSELLNSQIRLGWALLTGLNLSFWLSCKMQMQTWNLLKSYSSKFALFKCINCSVLFLRDVTWYHRVIYVQYVICASSGESRLELTTASISPAPTLA